ncbi:serine/threonine-protein kinase haspin [Neopelma chrysocephalum]|uniref:serine/threonine-protein kinase haspin n=1 Tax=Neopelma chrysocephalum TaxID=114329 RepID=UPI000FCD2BD4|nr:serine/threonine-protein kinase haspin [Neopelma chrysocephalum]
MLPRPRLLRTYSRRAGYLRPLQPPDRWISPPQDRKRLFSSTSAGSSALSARSEDDPDFLPPSDCRPRAGGKRRAWARRLRDRRRETRGKENREPEPSLSSHPPSLSSSSPSLSSPSPSPPRRARRRRQGPPCPAAAPLLCSTPQWPPPARPRRPAPPAAGSLVLFSSATDGGSGSCSGLGDSPPPRRPRGRAPQVRLAPLLLSTTIESGSGLEHHPPPSGHRSGQRPALRGADSAVEEEEEEEWILHKSAEPDPGLQEPRRVLRSSVRGEPCWAQAAPIPQKAPSASPPAQGEARLAAPCDGAASDGPREHLTRDSAKGSSSCHTGPAERYQLVPVVVLDRQEVPRRMLSMKLNKKADVQPTCQQPESPVGRPGTLESKYKRTKPLQGSGEGSTCRKACISGFSASRWGRHPRLRPKRRKNKRQQQPINSFLRPQAKQKRAQREMSVDVRDNDCSLLNSSYSWARVRASLSFHKKKRVTTEDSFCSSILCTPAGRSQLSGYQASLSAGRAQGCSWSASSMILLAPRDSSVLELMLTDAEKVFGECHQEGPIAFEECIPLDKMKDCKKIGEGVFGEVFQINSERGPVALKIIPIEGTEKVNGEAQKSFGEILPEVIISKELSLLSEESVNRTVGFISLYSVHCVQGAYPKYLLEAWDKYHKKTGSENDRPDLFGDEQLFMVLEFEFGGSDLEHERCSFSSVQSAKSILHQVTASLAVAEQELHFEHRDLHWGNVLVKKTDAKELHYVLNGTTHTIPTAGIHINIIDYTLSRLEKDGLTVFCDLSTDEELFQGTGDYQFDIYRQMKAENSNCWTDYHPHSNVLWLHYLADKLLNDMRYKRKATTPALKKIKMQLTKFHKEVLTFESAHDVLLNSSLFQ